MYSKSRLPATIKFEYMILGGWSEGAVNRNEQEFKQYVLDEALRYNNPVRGKSS